MTRLDGMADGLRSAHNERGAREAVAAVIRASTALQTDNTVTQTLRRTAVEVAERILEREPFRDLCRKLARAVDNYTQSAGAISKSCTRPNK